VAGAPLGLENGLPGPLGAHWDGKGVNFALFSAHAEAVALCLFAEDGQETRLRLPARSGDIWHGYLPGIGPGARYGYRVFGPYDPAQGQRFNHHKLLLDPYARQLRGRWRLSDRHLAYIAGDGRGDLSFDRRDSGPAMPKCLVTAAPEPGRGRRDGPLVPWSRTVFYEAHLRGLTKRWKGMPQRIRGTFAGLGQPRVIAHLKDLGVTSIELLPICAFAHDRFLVERGLVNFWGYSPLNFFAPQPDYLAEGELAEIGRALDRLHDAGLEVLLDMVYNHTAELDRLGPTLCFRGIDNRSYYRLPADDKSGYLDTTGCGNSLNLEHPQVRQMVLDSMRYWVETFGIDGFRFDLAVTVGREAGRFHQDGAFFRAVAADPLLAGIKLVAEPWDVGPDGYQLGRFPPGWAEWNDRARDTTRRFWRGDPGMVGHLARCLHGSGELFEAEGRDPYASVNYVTCHDGFTLADLVCYAQRHNLANGEDNRDGQATNYSDNFGVEGPSRDSAVASLRERRRRNLLATLILMQGTPMLLAGDEWGHSQRGNNNAYCQDNELTWLSRPEDDGDFQAFVKRLLSLRAGYRVLRQPRFLHGRQRSAVTGFADIQWLAPDGSAMTTAAWQNPENRSLGLLLASDAQPGATADDCPGTLLMLFHAGMRRQEFILPKALAGGSWRCLLATDRPAAGTEPIFAGGGRLTLDAQSLAVFRFWQ